MSSFGKTNKDGRRYQRFNVQQRLQHFVLFTSFILLAFTGLPIKFSTTSWAQAIANLFGGLDNMLYFHLFGASMMVAVSVNHLFYLLFGALVGDISLAAVPTLKDFKDLKDNIAYQLGLTKERPKFGRYSYKEKFDYWAVFWGMVIMVGSGIMMWFPHVTAKVFPKWVLDAARAAHSDEAMLAILAIFIWHFYNVHFRPGVFPASLVWLHGEMTEHEMEEEHPLELPELEKRRRVTEQLPREVEDGKVTI